MSDPDFRPKTLLIHGVGLIGGSLGMAARRYGLADHIVGCGRNAERLELAVKLGAIDRFALPGDFDSECAVADLIVLCTPVSNIVTDLPRVLAAAKADAVITDVGSVKGAIVDASHHDPRFIGSHPMAGSEIAGVEAARATLFQEATWALTPVETTGSAALETVRAFAHGTGALTRVLTPLLHDQAVAVTSHLPHVIASALMSLADDQAFGNPDLAYMSAGSFADATRVAASHPKLWRDICMSNRPALSETLLQYRMELAQFQEVLESADADEIEAYFARGMRAKSSWPGR